ncbi:MAG: WD40/YVTN/BNR-like repeat-containing protein [Povalibacter sp.]
MRTILVSSWSDGLIAITGANSSHELEGRVVRGLAPDNEGGALAIVDGRTLSQRSSKGIWRTVAVSEFDLSCIVNVLGEIYVGTEDAQILRLGANGNLERLPGFDVVPGRDTWYAGTAVVDGKLVGPPLGIRSMTATCDGAVLLANVHVGGIPRSTDRGVSWHPTVKVEEDVHEVRAHDTRPDIVIAAAATGLCSSRDGGETWSVEQEGLHACYCSAVAFAGDDVLVAASEGHFAAQGAIYRRPIDGVGPLSRVSGGLPEWLDGIVDTACIATHGSMLALADGGGNIYVSENAGGSWLRADQRMPSASCVLIV